MIGPEDDGLRSRVVAGLELEAMSNNCNGSRGREMGRVISSRLCPAGHALCSRCSRRAQFAVFAWAHCFRNCSERQGEQCI